MKAFWLAIALIALCFFTACKSSQQTIRIAATPVPHADLLNQIKTDLAAEGITLKIIEVDDYNLPNRLLAEKQVDANFFQHEPFLQMQKKQFGYPLAILTKVHIEPLGVYSEKIYAIESIPDEAIIAIPNDPTNEARALKLLESQNLITLSSETQLATPLDIESNPKKFKFEEVDAPFLARVLPDVHLAVIPANFALQAELSPSKDALFTETGESPYANVLVVRESEINREEFKFLKEALSSEKLSHYITEKYQGCITSACEPKTEK
jgi:D-methionine transport system substrate-binding protein